MSLKDLTISEMCSELWQAYKRYLRDRKHRTPTDEVIFDFIKENFTVIVQRCFEPDKRLRVHIYFDNCDLPDNLYEGETKFIKTRPLFNFYKDTSSYISKQMNSSYVFLYYETFKALPKGNAEKEFMHKVVMQACRKLMQDPIRTSIKLSAKELE